MVQIVGCKNCGKSTIEFGQTTVDIKFSTHKWCDKCGQNKSIDESEFYCSMECFTKYMIKIIKEGIKESK